MYINIYIYMKTYIYIYKILNIYMCIYINNKDMFLLLKIRKYKRCAPESCFDCVSGNVCACLFWGVNGRFTFC